MIDVSKSSYSEPPELTLDLGRRPLRLQLPVVGRHEMRGIAVVGRRRFRSSWAVLYCESVVEV
jgi:hypothetical protein